MMRPELPATLLRYLADSQLEVRLWDKNKLVLKIVKDVGGESGLLTFHDVSHVNLPPRLEVAGITVVDPNEILSHFFDLHRPNDRQLDVGERFYLISGSWDESYFVIAAAVEYSIDS